MTRPTALAGEIEEAPAAAAERRAKAIEIVEKHGGVNLPKQETAKVFWQNRFPGMALHFWKSGRMTQGIIATALRMPALVEMAFALCKKYNLREEDFWFGINAMHPGVIGLGLEDE
jgi:hypothetical protein